MAMTLVSTTTVPSGGAASIEFTNIPQTGKDLLLLYSIRGVNTNGDNITVSLNGSTSNFTSREIEGTGSVVGSNSRTSAWGGYANGTNTSNTFNNGQIYLANYASSLTKSQSIDVVTENNSTTAYQYISARNWNDTSAITSITISGFTIPQHSSASLYIIS